MLIFCYLVVFCEAKLEGVFSQTASYKTEGAAAPSGFVIMSSVMPSKIRLLSSSRRSAGGLVFPLTALPVLPFQLKEQACIERVSTAGSTILRRSCANKV